MLRLGGRLFSSSTTSPRSSFGRRLFSSTTTTSPRSSLAWSNISKTLPLRAVLLDAQCILKSADEEPSEAEKKLKRAQPKLELRVDAEAMLKDGRIKDMLQSEMRDALKLRGINHIGKPWELRKRLEACLEAEQVGIRAAPGQSAAAPPAGVGAAAAAPSNSDAAASTPADHSSSSADEKRAAYAAKLRARTGASMLPGGKIAAPPKGLGDAPRLPDNVRPPGEEVTMGGYTWALQPGVRELLIYLDMRGMARLMMPSASVSSDEEAERQAAQLTHTMRVPPFTQVLGHEDTMACRRGESAPLARLRDALELPSSTELMLVTDDAAALRAAKAARSYSCYYYRRLPGRPSRLPTDFHADHMSGVKHAVEDLNGVTFRDPSTEIRTEYGVSTT